MKNLILFCLMTFGLVCHAQSTAPRGAYLAKQGDTNMLALLADNYISITVYTDSEYKSTMGGPFTVNGNQLEINIEYNDANPGQIGTTHTETISFQGDDITDSQGNQWVKQAAKRQDLDGLWAITGRMQDGNIVRIHQTGTRKTIKLLVDGYFQWMAIDPGAKTFSGSGGGHYTFKDGKYSEHILFFSRDNSRVDAHLSFDGKIEDGEWHHSGLSSKGDPIYEIWSREN